MNYLPHSPDQFIRRQVTLLLALVLLLAFSGCTTAAISPAPTTSAAITPTPIIPAAATPAGTTDASPTASVANEQAVTVIPLSGPLAKDNAELSGLAWAATESGDYLLLLPQYPGRFDDAIFALPKTDLLAYLDGAVTTPLEPQPIPFDAAGIPDQIDNFEGYESIAVDGNQVYLTIEARPGNQPVAYLVTGWLAEDLSRITLESAYRAEIPAQAGLENMTDEAVLVWQDGVLTFHEANGINVNPHPVAHRFDLVTLRPQPEVNFPNIEYRITDTTAPDELGRFWAINYFFPGDTKLKPAPDPLVARFGLGPTHATSPVVERLVEFQFSSDGIHLTEVAPVTLQLLPDEEARNWEGLVLLETRGFLLATDKYPHTILAFVPRP
ncbi:MAG TPA: hypothetical protein PKG95_03345 [Anaerolineaceae bacterium]|jgi:hypothetical protein|nr:hypothetical protein [Anaerolineaceae bacterium]